MTIIFRFAAAVVIGFLVLQLVQMHRYPPDFYKILNNYYGKINILKSAISGYYRKNNSLPNKLTDLDCSVFAVLNQKRERKCAETYSNGAFYIRHKQYWASIEPYVSNEGIAFKCKAAPKLIDFSGPDLTCTELDEDNIPK